MMQFELDIVDNTASVYVDAVDEGVLGLVIGIEAGNLTIFGMPHELLAVAQKIGQALEAATGNVVH